jgi:hypothetical protein
MLKQAIDNQIDKSKLNDFQTNTWESLLSFLKKIYFTKISCRCRCPTDDLHKLLDNQIILQRITENKITPKNNS